ncbi:MAG: DUF3311 domain-containing protein [Bacilli bacterium]
MEKTVSQRSRWWNLLLFIPWVAVLWVPFYATATPSIGGFPFFYFYQFIWIVISGLLTAIVYWILK